MTTGGYLAAKIARKGPLINGTLSSFIYVLSGLYMLTGPFPEYWVRNAISAAIAPLLGLLGGYLYMRRQRNFLQVRT